MRYHRLPPCPACRKSSPTVQLLHPPGPSMQAVLVCTQCRIEGALVVDSSRECAQHDCSQAACCQVSVNDAGVGAMHFSCIEHAQLPGCLVAKWFGPWSGRYHPARPQPQPPRDARPVLASRVESKLAGACLACGAAPQQVVVVSLPTSRGRTRSLLCDGCAQVLLEGLTEAVRLPGPV